MRNIILIIIIGFTSCVERNSSDISNVKSSMKLIFHDDFAKSDLDTTKWSYFSSSPKPYDKILPRGNCDYTNAALLKRENVIINNGLLNLIAKNESNTYQGIVEMDKGKSLNCNLTGQDEFEFNLSYSSGSIFLKKGYNLGLFECRAKIPCTKGLYPVFWLWHHDEIVVFEFFGNSAEHYVSSHNKEKYVTTKFTKANYCDDFHTYSVLWEEDEIIWYFDNKIIWKICRDELLNKDVAHKFPSPINSNYNISESLPDIHNRWLSPNISLRIYEWSKSIDSKALPDTLILDYIKIYQNETIK